MLKRLVIKNFQRHRKLVIKFDPHVTTIVGKNDVGKTAITRALRWVILNKPTGKTFVRHGASRTSVTLSFDDHIVERVTGKGINTYSLDGTILKAFRTDVPVQIANLLRTTELNFQRQHDSAFWFSLTPGQVTKALNKLVDLSSIDALQAYLAKQLRDARTLHLAARRRVADARQLINPSAGSAGSSPKFKSLPPLMGDIARKRTRIARIASQLVNGSRLAPACKRSTRAASGVHTTAVAGRAVRSAGERVQRLQSLTDQMRAAGGAVGPVPKLPINSSEPLAAGLSVAERLIERIERSNKRINKRKQSLEKKLGGRCPSCGGILTDQSPI